MRVMAQVAMVMNLDKCIGCHTCSVTCKQTWTNRGGAEYMWFNNVETKPGVGYPRRWEDQQAYRGGWTLDRRGRLKLASGGQFRKLLSIFSNPDLPLIDDYYEPWTYDYETLTRSPLSDSEPVARPRSTLTGADLELRSGPNWDDGLAGGPDNARQDPVFGQPLLARLQVKVRLDFEHAFLFYLPRICEHCLNPSCVASCPSGAMYKRVEDGIVLVDQDRCRGWRYCVSGCPYKKVYFNHRTGKAEKCTLCYPRIETGMPTVCSETCVGRLRYLGLVLYDADRVHAAASEPEPARLLEAQLGLFLDPEDPEVRRHARAEGIPDDWIEAARRSPVYALAVSHRVALPLHPEFRTLPMVWYIPPLSPVVGAAAAMTPHGRAADPGPDEVFHAIEEMRIPLRYLAGLLSAGDPEPVRAALAKLTAVREHMRACNLGTKPDAAVGALAGIDDEGLESLYRLLALAPYDERYVVPPAHREVGERLLEHAGNAGFGFESGLGGCGGSEKRLGRGRHDHRHEAAGFHPTSVAIRLTRKPKKFGEEPR